MIVVSINHMMKMDKKMNVDELFNRIESIEHIRRELIDGSIEICVPPCYEDIARMLLQPRYGEDIPSIILRVIPEGEVRYG